MSTTIDSSGLDDTGRLLTTYYADVADDSVASGQLEAVLGATVAVRQRRSRMPWRARTGRGRGMMSHPGLIAAMVGIGMLTVLGASAVLVGTAGPDGDPLVPADHGVFTPAARPPLDVGIDSATGLLDGRVLAIGGTSAQVWDPTSGVWSDGGKLPFRRYGHAVTRLSDGRVLILGGYRSTDTARETLADVAIWDPDSETFISSAPMSEPRSRTQGLLASVLDDDRVLVAGGSDGDLPTAEIRDPRSGAFTPLAMDSQIIQAQALVPMVDGKVMVFGPSETCLQRGQPYSAIAEAWGLDSGRVTGAGSLPPMDDPLSACGVTAATPLPDGRILVTTCEYGGSAEAYVREEDGTFIYAGTLGDVGSDFAVVRLGDGRALIAGGAHMDQDSLSSAAIWDPASGTFMPTGRMAQARTDPFAIPLEDGRVLVVGGARRARYTDLDAVGLTDAEVFELKP